MDAVSSAQMQEESDSSWVRSDATNVDERLLRGCELTGDGDGEKARTKTMRPQWMMTDWPRHSETRHGLL